MGNTLMTIPLCRLKQSKTNIRKTDRLTGIEELTSNIEANGLLENLVVTAIRNPVSNEQDCYEVVAGGRGLAALKLLAKRKKIDRDYGVFCLVLETDAVGACVEVSLAENIVRAPVHPADQFDAFLKLQREGLPVEDIAARFGISPTIVLQRLKLAVVSPRLMSQYRSGAMNLEQLMAFAISDDHSAQETFWFENPFGEMSPQAIRRWLTRSHIHGQDRRARFIGAKSYEEAGGIIINDLFEPESEAYFTDSQLLDRLVAEKLSAEADKIRAEGWAWIETSLETDFSHLARFGRLKMTEVQLSDEDETRLTMLSDRYGELVSAIEDEGDKETLAELDRLSEELNALRMKKEIWPEFDKARAGAVLSLGHDGDLRVERGLVKPADRSDIVESDGHEENARAHNERTERTERSASLYSDALLTDLSAHRTMALREMLASQPDQALIALLNGLVRCVFFEKTNGCIDIVPTLTDLGKFSQTVGESKAAAALLVRHQRWLGTLPESSKLSDWLGRLGTPERLDLLAYCIALCLDGVCRSWRDEGRQAAVENLATALSLDMADWWQPTKLGFLERVTKDQILAAVREGASREAALRLSGLSKGQMAEKAEILLTNSRWLPEPLRKPASLGVSYNQPVAEAAAE